MITSDVLLLVKSEGEKLAWTEARQGKLRCSAPLERSKFPGTATATILRCIRFLHRSGLIAYVGFDIINSTPQPQPHPARKKARLR